MPRFDFSIASDLLDTHESMSDAIIDDLGQDCALIYPASIVECDNCILDPSTGRSSGIYKTGGPVPFPNYTVCPRCGGEGREKIEETESITLRVYWEPKSWIKLGGVDFAQPDGLAMTIGYMTALPKIERAERILLNSDVQHMRRWTCEREGEAAPWGFRQNRYFVQYVRRIRGG